MEVFMKRLAVILGAVLVPVLFTHLLLAAGFFKVGEKAPSFALNAISGEPVTLDAYKGKVDEATQGKNVAVVGVNSSGNSKKEVGEFLSAFPVKVTYPYLLDPGKVTDKLYGGGKFIPNVYVIDQQGVIRWQRVGNMELAGADVIIAEVEKLLAAGSSNKM